MVSNNLIIAALPDTSFSNSSAAKSSLDDIYFTNELVDRILHSTIDTSPTEHLPIMATITCRFSHEKWDNVICKRCYRTFLQISFNQD